MIFKTKVYTQNFKSKIKNLQKSELPRIDDYFVDF